MVEAAEAMGALVRANLKRNEVLGPGLIDDGGNRSNGAGTAGSC